MDELSLIRKSLLHCQAVARSVLPVVETVLYRGSTVHIGAQVILDHRLCMPGWIMGNVCTSILNGDEQTADSRVAITYVNEKPVSACLAFCRPDEKDPEVHTFTKWAYRRCGYGTLAVVATGVQDFDYRIGRSEEETVGFYESLSN